MHQAELGSIDWVTDHMLTGVTIKLSSVLPTACKNQMVQELLYRMFQKQQKSRDSASLGYPNTLYWVFGTPSTERKCFMIPIAFDTNLHNFDSYKRTKLL